MDETTLEPTREGMLEEIKKCREDLFLSLLGYAVFIGVLVFFDYEEALFFLSFVSGGRAAETSVLGRILYACLPLAMALYGKKARFPGNLITVYAVVEGLQYVFLGFWVVFVLHLLGGGFDAFISLLMSCTLFGVPLFLLYRVWRMARRLSAVQRALGGTGSSNKWMVFLALACYLAPAYIPTMEGVRLQRLILDTQEVTRYELGAYITYMAGSPDGSLLALGTEKGLYVWDTTSRECVWSDDCLAVQRVRFSPSGRYLAAAGRGRPEGAMDREA